MDAPIVALDLGNRRLKAGWFTATGQLERTLTLAYDKVESQWAAWLAQGGAVGHALASVVCDPARARDVLAMIEAGLGQRVEINPACGLQMAVRSPETVGMDRLYAARAVLARGLERAIVVDVGTAMTVDAVTRATSDGDGETWAGTFLGGAIAPGPELVAEALAGPQQLYAVSPRPDAPALGRDTRTALEAGVAHTVAGAALRLAGCVRSESGLDGAALVLTGGARAFVAPALAQAGWEIIEAPHLVLDGLAACARSTGQAST